MLGLVSSNYELDGFRSLMNPEGSWWTLKADTLIPKAINWFVDFIFSIVKLFWEGVDIVIDKFSNETIIETSIDSVFSVARKLYDSLFSSFGVLLFCILVVYIFYKWAFSNGSGKVLVSTIIVIMLNGLFFTKGDVIVKDVNSFFNETETLVVKAIALPTYDDEEVVGSDSTETMRNVLFNQMVLQPFKNVNFGKDVSAKELEPYVIKKGKNSEERVEEIDKKVEKDSKDNRYLSPDKLDSKMTVMLVSFINSGLMGFVTAVLILFQMLLKYSILGLIIISPIMGILSLFPIFQGTILKTLGKMLQLFAVGAFSSGALFIVFFIYNLVDSTAFKLVPSLQIAVFLSMIIKILFTYLVWKNKGQIISLITAGYVTSAGIKVDGLGKEDGKRSWNRLKSAESALSRDVLNEDKSALRSVNEEDKQMADESLGNSSMSGGVRQSEGEFEEVSDNNSSESDPQEFDEPNDLDNPKESLDSNEENASEEEPDSNEMVAPIDTDNVEEELDSNELVDPIDPDDVSEDLNSNELVDPNDLENDFNDSDYQNKDLDEINPDVVIEEDNDLALESLNSTNKEERSTELLEREVEKEASNLDSTVSDVNGNTEGIQSTLRKDNVVQMYSHENEMVSQSSYSDNDLSQMEKSSGSSVIEDEFDVEQFQKELDEIRMGEYYA